MREWNKQEVCKMQIILKRNELKHFSDCSFEELLLPSILTVETEKGKMPTAIQFCSINPEKEFFTSFLTFTLFIFVNNQALYSVMVKGKRYAMEAYYSDKTYKKGITLVELRWPKVFPYSTEKFLTFKPSKR